MPGMDHDLPCWPETSCPRLRPQHDTPPTTSSASASSAQPPIEPPRQSERVLLRLPAVTFRDLLHPLKTSSQTSYIESLPTHVHPLMPPAPWICCPHFLPPCPTFLSLLELTAPMAWPYATLHCAFARSHHASLGFTPT